MKRVGAPKVKMGKKTKAVDTRNEEFDIACFYMGQGDCSMIRCPNGQIVMVDCGSKSDFSDASLKIAADLVRSTNWAGGNKNTIDALILTHKDQDHYSQAGTVLGDPTINSVKYKELTIKTIYFSWASADNSPLGRYKTNGLNRVVYGGFFKTEELYEVTIRGTAAGSNFYKKWTDNDDFANVVSVSGATQVPIVGRKLTVLTSATPSGKTWRVSLIAGNVEKVAKAISDMGDGKDYQDGAPEDNARSLVTLLEIGTKKALFCGDATFSTERFLVLTQAAMISNVDFILAPHHGSEWASSPPFVNATNAQRVAVSSEYMEHSHMHPRKVAVTHWLARAQGAAPHKIDHWENSPTKADKLLASWQKQGLDLDSQPSQSGPSRFIWLTNLPTADIYYGVKRRIGVLYREEVSKKVDETAMLDQDDPTTPQFLRYQLS